jgi:flagellar biosynthesis/type III secretory pathway protein FliH
MLTNDERARLNGFDYGYAEEYATGYVAGYTEGNDEGLYPEELSQVARHLRRRGYDAGVAAYCQTLEPYEVE